MAAILLTKYRIVFAPGENGEALARDMLDQVTAQPGKFRVVFETRSIPYLEFRVRMIPFLHLLHAFILYNPSKGKIITGAVQ